MRHRIQQPPNRLTLMDTCPPLILAGEKFSRLQLKCREMAGRFASLSLIYDFQSPKDWRMSPADVDLQAAEPVINLLETECAKKPPNMSFVNVCKSAICIMQGSAVIASFNSIWKRLSTDGATSTLDDSKLIWLIAIIGLIWIFIHFCYSAIQRLLCIRNVLDADPLTNSNWTGEPRSVLISFWPGEIRFALARDFDSFPFNSWMNEIANEITR